MVQFLSIFFFSWISSIFVGFFKSSHFFCVILYVWVSGVKTGGRMLEWQTLCLSTLQIAIGQAPVEYELLYRHCDPAVHCLPSCPNEMFLRTILHSPHLRHRPAYHTFTRRTLPQNYAPSYSTSGWLRRCPTRRKVAGSISDGVI